MTKIVQSEEQEQIALMQRARLHPILKLHLIHIPNEQKLLSTVLPTRRFKILSKLKAMGVKSGVSDLFLSYPSGKYHGMWLELKRPPLYKPKTSKQQLDWLNQQMAIGYYCCVAYGQDEAWAKLQWYLSLNVQPYCPDCLQSAAIKKGFGKKMQQRYLCKNDDCERHYFFWGSK